MEISQLIPHVEALIFAADRPLPVADILELLNNALAFLEDRATQEQVEAAIEAIQEKYNSEFYAFSVRESGGGYQFLTKKDYYQTVAQLNGEKFLKRLSTAALETLAIIAYKQPISKGEIEHIRGVSTDYSITKLLEKELIVISGRSEELPGKPLLYSTSKAFMDYFGLNSPADLPKLKEVFEEDFVPPTQLTLDSNTEELRVDDELTGEDGHLSISETGELTETTTIMMDEEPTEEHTAEGGGAEGSGGPEAALEEVPEETEEEISETGTEEAEEEIAEEEISEPEASLETGTEEAVEEETAEPGEEEISEPEAAVEAEEEEGEEEKDEEKEDDDEEDDDEEGEEDEEDEEEDDEEEDDDDEEDDDEEEEDDDESGDEDDEEGEEDEDDDETEEDEENDENKK